MNAPLYPWQADALSTAAPRLLIQASPRCGKSRVGAEWLAGIPGLAVVVAPLAVGPMWRGLAEATGRVALPGYAMTGAKLKNALVDLRGASAEVCLVVNFAKLPAIVDVLLRLRPAALLIDESHQIKAPGSARGRACRRLAWATPNVRLLTGTLAPNGPQDLWGQLTCVGPETWGRSFTAWAKEHLIIDAMYYNRVLGVRHPARLQEMVDVHARTYRREDVFGPDSWTFVNRDFDLSPKARRIYDEIVKSWILESEEDGVKLDLTHAVSRILRLQQLTSGYLPGDDGAPVAIHEQKLELILADLDDIIVAGEKAVVFYRFRWEGEQLASRIRSELDCPVYEIHGGVPADVRARDLERFRAGGRAVFVVQTDAGGVGISLATAQHALFASQSWSFDAEEQARDRVFAPGAARTVTYYRANRTVDGYIAEMLRTKRDMHEAVRSSRIQDIAYGAPTKKGKVF